MKNIFLQTLKLTVICIVCFSGIYTAIIYGVAQAMPNRGKGETISANGKTYYANIGQEFKSEGYFNARPSAVAYNAAGSGGSNKGPSNPEYLADAQKRIDSILSQNPDMQKKDIPVEMVTASASGLDPHISVLSAKFQMKRIAKARNIKVAELETLIENNTDKPLLRLFGPEKINVLKLNIALDKLANK
ncbi:K(+)-transporting ATPase subunit C [Flavobacterium sp. DG1-102-2]|uniref:K(+)-transporting ATPase subunit C n=1 Tax=Flavobacterium sp. DG1-102-2 TaxID=3081663 RepID=UPI00294A4A37|nr:K(+)-transporting ATPase subunit C [Flavobacterium sp. DG1-102-2]MDV6167402.1 K(+)-transporting ATPase subunit C [Flavobacterium sp. DG1-102-2]